MPQPTAPPRAVINILDKSKATVVWQRDVTTIYNKTFQPTVLLSWGRWRLLLCICLLFVLLLVCLLVARLCGMEMFRHWNFVLFVEVSWRTEIDRAGVGMDQSSWVWIPSLAFAASFILLKAAVSIFSKKIVATMKKILQLATNCSYEFMFILSLRLHYPRKIKWMSRKFDIGHRSWCKPAHLALFFG